MDEQVVPNFAPARAPLKRCATVPSNLPGLVPDTGPPPASSSTSFIPQPSKPTISPAPEYPGKMRWETPLRAGRHPEPWQGARELGLECAVRTRAATGVMAAMRAVVADVVVAYVGGGLPAATVQKWLCLLCEYLELNADEVVLVVCLLRRYVKRGGRFVGKGDWARPQRWECVVAVACYLAVLLTEEFPGRTAMDLRELLGPNFRFGSEQVSFLKVVDWRISISSEVFKEVKEAMELVIAGKEEGMERIREWFKVEEAVLERKRKMAEDAAAMATIAAQQKEAQQQQQALVGKKRSFAAIAPADDSVVPRVVVPRMDAMHHVPAAAFIPGVPAVPHWALQPW